MADNFYNSSKDPADNSIPRPYVLRSDSKGGSTTATLGVEDLTIPSSPNFPPLESGSATRYLCHLPMDAYRTTTSSTGFSVRNETQAVDLTIVEPTASLTDYTCKFFGVTSERRNVLEVHVGSTSNVAADTLSYQGVFVGGVIEADRMNNIECVNVNTQSTIAGTKIIASSWVQADAGFAFKKVDATNGSSTSGMAFITRELGAWDMDTLDRLSISSTDFGVSLTEFDNIRDVNCTIYGDSIGQPIYNFEIANGVVYGGLIGMIPSTGSTASGFEPGSLFLIRQAAGNSGQFDHTEYNSTAINRGFVTITYEVD